jgi:predicted nucleotidyltransferase
MLDLIEQHRAELVGLCRRHHVARLELFGSAVTDAFNPETSDLDFLVDFLPLPLGARADAYFGLLHGLEDLFRRHIDLVTTQANRNPWFQRAIDRQRTVLYAT